jgi:hypothetical protein
VSEETDVSAETLSDALAAAQRSMDPDLPASGEAEQAVRAFALLFPGMLQYRGGWFRADRFAESYAEQWFAQPGATLQGVEGMMNHLDVLEDYPGGDESTSIEVANALAQSLAYSWPRWVRARYGVDMVSTVYAQQDEGETYSYTVTLHSRVG